MSFMHVFKIFLHRSVELGAVSCVNLVFLMDKITHKQMQNLGYVKLFLNTSVTLEHICSFKISTIAALNYWVVAKALTHFCIEKNRKNMS